ncbi:PREDICTED: trihelix transcription factor GTL1-like [Cyphomyrmex costatus]|nr:PREDICTED: trihelix transcription factor GTL1-like [Cyphomyrmex costatus]
MQKRVWKDIASNFHEKGYNITDEQCLTKWKNLKQKYKHVRENNNETGRAAQTWEYFNMIDEFLHTRPEILPVSVASSTHGFRIRERSPCTDYEEYNNENDPAVSNTSYGIIRNVRKRQKRHTTILEQLFKQREEHHKKNVECKRNF